MLGQQRRGKIARGRQERVAGEFAGMRSRTSTCGDDASGCDERLGEVGLGARVVMTIGEVSLVTCHADHQVHPAPLREIRLLLQGEATLATPVADATDVKDCDPSTQCPARNRVSGLMLGAAAKHFGRNGWPGH